MKPRAILGLILGVFLFLSPGFSQAKKAAFDGQAAFEHVKVLASDAMLGRKSGELGGQLGAEYIVRKLKEWGLEPAGPAGSFYQDMTIEYYEVERGAGFDIIAHNRKREFVYGEDWRQQRFSGSGTFGAGVVFVGYGISAPQKEYDDYAGLDVKDKLVLFAVETPRRFEESLKEEAKFENRVKAAQEHGARGVLTFRSDTQAAPGFFGFRGGLKKESYRPDFIIISLENKIVDFIFKWQKADPRFFFQQIEMTGKPQSFDLGVQSLVNLRATFDEKRPTQNVLAKITGTDKLLRNEYVIVGAHMDHLGIDMTGDVLNGADDNASGTAVVMEVGRLMKLNKFRPKRTVVFALWAAEEMGLLGSKYYTENPVYPLDQTVAYINLDMEGHGTGKVNFRGVYYAPEIWDLLKARLPKELIDNVNPGRGGPGGSDHTYFLSSGVPGYFVATDGPHFKTNRVGDVIELIKPEILKKAGDFVGAATEALASEPKVPIQTRRRETYQWRYQTIINYRTPPHEKVIAEHKDVQDPDVDFQLAAIAEKEGLTGDGLRVEVLKGLLAGQEKIGEAKGLTLYGRGAPAMGGRMMGGAQPSRTTVLLGLRGIASFRDDPRFADVFSKQGVAFVSLDQPGFLFAEKGLSDEGKKIVDGLGKANLLFIASGLSPEQAKALLENVKKPVLLKARDVPGKEVLDLVKKTNSCLGLVLGKDEEAAAYFKKIDDAKKAVGSEYLAIVSESCLWESAGKELMLNVIGELIKAKYENEDLMNLFTGSFMRALTRARGDDASRPSGFMMF